MLNTTMHAEHDDAHLLVLAQQPAQELQAADAGEVEVEQHQLGTDVAEHGQRLFAGRSLVQLRPAHARQQAADALTDNDVIVNQQDLHCNVASCAS
jgi:hypothetical protein